MKTARYLTLATFSFALIGCAARQQQATPAKPLPALPAETNDTKSIPSLASEAGEQNRRDADAIGRAIGVRVEPLGKATAPAWYAEATTAAGRGAGSASAITLNEAVDAAVTRAGSQVAARGGDPQTLRVERAAWKRLATGQYAAWATVGDGTRLGPPPARTDIAADTGTPQIDAAPMPTLAQPRLAIATGGPAVAPAPVQPVELEASEPAPTPTAAAGQVVVAPAATAKSTEAGPAAGPVAVAAAPAAADAAGPIVVAPANEHGTPAAKATAAAKPAAEAKAEVKPAPKAEVKVTEAAKAAPLPLDSGAPNWWTLAAAERNGRVVIGVRSDGLNSRECVRNALRAGREQLQKVTGEEPRELLTDRSVSVALPDGRIRVYSLVSCQGTIKKVAEEAAPQAEPQK